MALEFISLFTDLLFLSMKIDGGVGKKQTTIYYTWLGTNVRMATFSKP